MARWNPSDCRHIFKLAFIALLGLLVGCEERGPSAVRGAEDRRAGASAALSLQMFESLDKANQERMPPALLSNLEHFISSLQAERWSDAWGMLTTAFQESMPLEIFSAMNRRYSGSHMDFYILNASFVGSSSKAEENLEEADIVLCLITRKEGKQAPRHRFSSMVWRRMEGTWKCEKW